MGINADEAKAILALKRDGAVGGEILCLGRPELFVAPRAMRGLNAGFNLGLAAADVAALSKARFAEGFLARCGFTQVRSLDASPYEGAEVIHDLNTPLPPELLGITDFVYDGGTCEHVFDIAQALRNVVGLLRVGGTALISSPANGQCGHGFYQLSPELFHRFFEANGFDNIAVFVVGLLGPSKWFRATDPAQLRKRVQFMTSEPVQIIAMARKAKALPAAVNPQQSDYAQTQWGTDAAGAAVDPHADWRMPKARAKAFVRDRMVYPAAVALRHMTGLGMPMLWKKAQFLPVDPMKERLAG